MEEFILYTLFYRVTKFTVNIITVFLGVLLTAKCNICDLWFLNAILVANSLTFHGNLLDKIKGQYSLMV